MTANHQWCTGVGMSITPLWQLQKKCSSCYCGLIDGQTYLERQDIQQSYTLPKTNIAPENWPSQKESSLPYLFSGAMLAPGRALFQAWTSDCENSETESQRFDCITTCPIPPNKNLQDLRSFQFVDKFLLQPLPGSKSTSSLSQNILVPQPSGNQVMKRSWSPAVEADVPKWFVRKTPCCSLDQQKIQPKKRNKTIVGPSDLEVTTSWLEYSESQVWMNDSHSNPIFVAKVAQFHHQAFTVHDGETWP